VSTFEFCKYSAFLFVFGFVGIFSLAGAWAPWVLQVMAVDEQGAGSPSSSIPYFCSVLAARRCLSAG